MKKILANIFNQRVLPVTIVTLSLVFSFSLVAMADDVSTQVSVGNATPSVSSTVWNDSTTITLTENTTTTVVATTTVTDSNGCNTITGVSADFYLTSVGAANCDENGEDDSNNCYAAVNCVESTHSGETCTGGADTSANYVCTVQLDYYTDPGGWTVTVEASDGTATSTTDSDTESVNTLLALDVTASINYGALSANTDTGSTNQTTTVTNTGNADMDPQLSGTSLTDSTTPITVDNQEYSLTAFTYNAGTDLSGTPTTFDMVLPQRTAGVVTDDVLWGIAVPNGTVTGTYTGTNTFTAVSGI